VSQFLYILDRKNKYKNPIYPDLISAEEIYLKIYGSTVQMDKTRWTKEAKTVYRQALLSSQLGL